MSLACACCEGRNGLRVLPCGHYCCNTCFTENERYSADAGQVYCDICGQWEEAPNGPSSLPEAISVENTPPAVSSSFSRPATIVPTTATTYASPMHMQNVSGNTDDSSQVFVNQFNQNPDIPFTINSVGTNYSPKDVVFDMTGMRIMTVKAAFTVPSDEIMRKTIDEAAQQLRPKLTAFIDEHRYQKDVIDEYASFTQMAIQRLEEHHQESRRKITAYFQTLREELNKREKELLDQSDAITSSTRNDLSTTCSQLRANSEKINFRVQLQEKVVSSGTPFEICATYMRSGSLLHEMKGVITVPHCSCMMKAEEIKKNTFLIPSIVVDETFAASTAALEMIKKAGAITQRADIKLAIDIARKRLENKENRRSRNLPLHPNRIAYIESARFVSKDQLLKSHKNSSYTGTIESMIDNTNMGIESQDNFGTSGNVNNTGNIQIIEKMLTSTNSDKYIGTNNSILDENPLRTFGNNSLFDPFSDIAIGPVLPFIAPDQGSGTEAVQGSVGFVSPDVKLSSSKEMMGPIFEGDISKYSYVQTLNQGAGITRYLSSNTPNELMAFKDSNHTPPTYSSLESFMNLPVFFGSVVISYTDSQKNSLASMIETLRNRGKTFRSISQLFRKPTDKIPKMASQFESTEPIFSTFYNENGVMASAFEQVGTILQNCTILEEELATYTKERDEKVIMIKKEFSEYSKRLADVLKSMDKAIKQDAEYREYEKRVLIDKKTQFNITITQEEQYIQAQSGKVNYKKFDILQKKAEETVRNYCSNKESFLMQEREMQQRIANIMKAFETMEVSRVENVKKSLVEYTEEMNKCLASMASAVQDTLCETTVLNELKIVRSDLANMLELYASALCSGPSKAKPIVDIVDSSPYLRPLNYNYRETYDNKMSGITKLSSNAMASNIPKQVIASENVDHIGAVASTRSNSYRAPKKEQEKTVKKRVGSTTSQPPAQVKTQNSSLATGRPANAIKKARAIYDYQNEDDDPQYINIAEGDEFWIISEVEGWSECIKVSSPNIKGLAPTSYLEDVAETAYKSEDIPATPITRNDIIRQVIAKYSVGPTDDDPDMLQTEEGDRIDLLEEIGDDGIWYNARNTRTGEKGQIPNNYFDEI